MQTASGTLTTAITAQQRQPKHQLLVDWDNDGNYTSSDDDQTSNVESLTITRTLSSDLPDDVDLLAGYSSTEVSVQLAHTDPTDVTKDTGWYYSPWSTSSPLYGRRRRWRRMQVSLGFAGTAGTELLPAFTGRTEALTTQGAAKNATLTGVDNGEMQQSITLPVIVADNQATGLRPGLTGAWLVDWVARQCGYHASPTARTGCRWLATFAGSAYPEVGNIFLGVNNAAAPTLTAGKFIQGITVDNTPGASDSRYAYGMNGTLTTNNGGEILIEGWSYIPTSSGGHPLIQITSDYTVTNANRVTLMNQDWAMTGNTLAVIIQRTNTGAGTTYDSGIPIVYDQWVYTACHVNLTSSTITMHWRYGTTSATTTASTSSVTGQPDLTQVYIGGEGTGYHALSSYEAWQVSNPGLGTSVPSWNDSYAGNAVIQPSLNKLTAAVPGSDTGWNQIGQIATAELATFGIDESGRFTFYNRSRWTSAPYTTSQRTIDASALKDLTVTEDVAQVRNRIRITASPAAVQKAAFVWRAADVVTVPASGSTSVTAVFETAATGVVTSVTHSAANNPTTSYYRATSNRDGSGSSISNLTFTVTTDGRSATISISNPNAYPVYVVNPPGFNDAEGTPALGLWGQAVLYAQSAEPDTTTPGVTVPTQTVVDVSDATSITNYGGEKLYEIQPNPWLQDASSVASLANDLLARLKDPPPVLSTISIPADPRLQLGDRVTVVASQFGLSADFFLTGITTTVTTGGGAGQDLTTRAV